VQKQKFKSWLSANLNNLKVTQLSMNHCLLYIISIIEVSISLNKYIQLWDHLQITKSLGGWAMIIAMTFVYIKRK